jgi:hypothetical protein
MHVTSPRSTPVRFEDTRSAEPFMIVPLTSNQNRALRRPQKGRANLSRKEKDPGYSHTAGVFARTHTHKHTLRGRLWLGASEALDIVTLNVGLFRICIE